MASWAEWFLFCSYGTWKLWYFNQDLCTVYRNHLYRKHEMMNGLFGVCILCWSSTEMAGVCFEWIMRMPLSFSPKWISYILQTITMSSYLMYHNKQTCYQIFVIIFMGTICKQNNIDSVFSFSAYPPNGILSRSTFHLLSYDESGLFFSFAIIFDLHTLIPNWIVSFKLFHNSKKTQISP